MHRNELKRYLKRLFHLQLTTNRYKSKLNTFGILPLQRNWKEENAQKRALGCGLPEYHN